MSTFHLSGPRLSQADGSSATPSATRNSSIELLRIVAMLMVMVVHADFRSLGAVTYAEIDAEPLSAFMRCLVQSASGVCVNVFVLISGWFGIRVKRGKLLSLLFQIAFFTVVVAVAVMLMRGAPLTMAECKTLLGLGGSYWFVKSYLLLYLFAPVLNAFAESVPRRRLRLFLACFFAFQSLYGWLTDTAWFAQGYSPLSFMGLYLLARHLRSGRLALDKATRWRTLLLYAAITLSTAVGMMIVPSGLLYVYSSPLLIAASVSFLLFFCCLKVDSRAVNYVASSCFAAYLVHAHPLFFDFMYTSSIAAWYGTMGTLGFLFHTALWIAGLFLCAVFADKLRIALWSLLHFKCLQHIPALLGFKSASPHGRRGDGQ